MRCLTQGLMAFCLVAVLAGTGQSAIVLFDLQGNAGNGLLAGNENQAVLGNPGTGGEVGAGISFDDVSRELTINVGWGAAQGFTGALTGAAIGMHIHGPTTDLGFSDNRPVLIPLDGLAGFNNAADGGGFNATLAPMTALQAADLVAGRFYINVHTTMNGGGELRGHLVAVPEPSGFMLSLLSLAVVLPMRHRRTRS